MAAAETADASLVEVIDTDMAPLMGAPEGHPCATCDLDPEFWSSIYTGLFIDDAAGSMSAQVSRPSAEAVIMGACTTGA